MTPKPGASVGTDRMGFALVAADAGVIRPLSGAGAKGEHIADVAGRGGMRFGILVTGDAGHVAAVRRVGQSHRGVGVAGGAWQRVASGFAMGFTMGKGRCDAEQQDEKPPHAAHPARVASFYHAQIPLERFPLRAIMAAMTMIRS
ncbi:MAG: hypothetical protein RIB46_03810 [Pseudomonadales bacterium]